MVRINLLPIRDILRKRELKQFVLLVGVALAATFGLMAVTYLYFSMQVSNLEQERKTQQTALNQLKEKNKEITTLKNEITRLQKQVDTIQKLTKTRDTPAPFMSAVSLAIPEEVWLAGITKTGRSFTLDGTGLDNTVVVNFVERLQKVKQGFTETNPWLDPNNKKDQSFFSDVKLVQIVQASQTGLSAMKFKIVGHIR